MLDESAQAALISCLREHTQMIPETEHLVTDAVIKHRMEDIEAYIVQYGRGNTVITTTNCDKYLSRLVQFAPEDLRAMAVNDVVTWLGADFSSLSESRRNAAIDCAKSLLPTMKRSGIYVYYEKK